MENVLKMREERAGTTRARAVSRGQMRHGVFLVKKQDRGLLRVMQTRHLKVSKSKSHGQTTCTKDKKDTRNNTTWTKDMLTWLKDMQGARVRATK